MKFAKITARGQTTIPKSIREAAGLREGDVIAFEVVGDRVVIRTVGRPDDYLSGLARSLGEWSSPEDEVAWREL
jgi:AbrB family looped-hinge helix DNA binding protein